MRIDGTAGQNDAKETETKIASALKM